MKYKILKKIPPEEARTPIIIKDGRIWLCDKCQVLYGDDEIILEDNDGGIFCSLHPKTSISSANMDYWERHYKIEETQR